MSKDALAPTIRTVSGLRAAYDHEAQFYDVRRHKSAEGGLFNSLELAILRAWLPLDSWAKILDLPAGTARLSVGLSESAATIVGGDISGNMLRVAAAKVRGAIGSRMSFVQANGTHLPFRDDSFDGLISFNFFHLIPNDEKPEFIKEMARVLKPGGPLIVEFNSPFYGGVLALCRYYLRKRHPGRMRTKCLFPDQIPKLFAGLEVTRKHGAKFPFSERLERVVGRRMIETVNLWLGRLPIVRYLAYVIIIEARKAPRTDQIPMLSELVHEHSAEWQCDGRFDGNYKRRARDMGIHQRTPCIWRTRHTGN